MGLQKTAQMLTEVDMKALIELMAKYLVDKPEEVSVADVDGEKTAIFELRVAKSDIGKVIGKQGNTARAMRTIMSAAGTKLDKRYVLEILD
jgi:hypothetical protein